MNPADLTINLSPTLPNRPLPLSVTAPLKNGKVSVPRVDLEGTYTQLKAALGDQWADYKAAVNQFMLGNLNQAELAWVLQPLLSPAPSVIIATSPAISPVSTLHLHNTLIACLYANVQRDPPPTEVAPWVVATDKPTTASKAAGAAGANDKGEERLRKEVMGMHARDRRRIKNLKADPARQQNGPIKEMLDYQRELEVTQPELVPAATGSLAKTNFDMEIRRRFAAPLASESLEFPTLSDIQSRIEPICYEEGLTGGANGSQALGACAELIEQAVEVYLKDILSQLCARSRSNGEDGIQTSKFRRQLRREEGDVERGTLQRNAAGLLPVEIEVAAKRESLNANDLRLALCTEDRHFKSEPYLAESIMLSQYPTPPDSSDEKDAFARRLTNGTSNKSDAMEVDEEDLGWQGSTKADMDSLLGVLDDCLTVG